MVDEIQEKVPSVTGPNVTDEDVTDEEAARQKAVLAEVGAHGDEARELLDYNKSAFDLTLAEPPTTPLPDEPFVDCWRPWVKEAQQDGAFEVLSRYLPQLRFPIREGMRTSDDYRAAVGRGVDPETLDSATGLPLERPEVVEVEIYRSMAGGIPIITARGREEFVNLVRALAKRNEPLPVPPAQGAVMIAGYANWQRIHALRRAWENTAPEDRENATWVEEFGQIRTQKELYLDRLIILSDGPYSAVAAQDLGLEEEEWRRLSWLIRREHECTHYYTRRVFDSMRNHLVDELIADYTGLVAARGRFEGDWFLRFLGLEDFPNYRTGARLDIYRGDPPLSDGAFRALHGLVVRGTRHLETFDHAHWTGGPRSVEDRALMVRALAALDLLQLAADDAPKRIENALRAAELS